MDQASTYVLLAACACWDVRLQTGNRAASLPRPEGCDERSASGLERGLR